MTVFARQIHKNKIKNVPGLDEYEPQLEETTPKALRFKEEWNRYNAQVYRIITQLYISWALGKADNRKELGTNEFSFIDCQKKFEEYRKALIEALRPTIKEPKLQDNVNDTDPEPFTPKSDKGRKRLKTGATRQVDFQFDQSDEEATPGHRKRKPTKLVEDSDAREKRERLNVINKRIGARAKNQEKKDRLAGFEPSQIRVNVGKYAKHNDIFFHDSFAKVLKPHQVEGIRFMWKQLIQTGENRGALLAHTMGLGKTLQV